MTLYFITGNKNKFSEIKTMIPEIEQLEIDLPEIQSFDTQEIIKHKLKEAFKHKQAEFIVEDTSLYFDCLNGLPGPLIKWFLERMEVEKLAEIVIRLGNTKSTAKTLIGYAKNPEEIHFFEGSLRGDIVSSKVKSNFGWDPIFQPEGFSKSFAEMTREEKNQISMRRLAINKLKEFLRNSE